MPKAVQPDLALILQFLRRGQGWTQAQLCRAAGVSPSRLNDYENDRETLTRARLERLAGTMGLPPERIDESLACLAANRAAAAPPGVVLDRRAVRRRKIEAIAARAGRLETDHTRALLTLLTDEGEALMDRQLAERQLARLKKRTAAERRFLVENAQDFRHWALCEQAAFESIRLAPNHPQEAREWAQLAVRIAELAPGEETSRQRLEGWALHFLANAERACNDLPAAERARARGRKLWEAGAPGDLGLLEEAWLPGLEANLRKDQRRFSEALERIDEALTLAPPEMRAEVLLSKSNILRRLDDPEGSTAVLLEAEPLIDAEREPRLAFGVRFNLLVDLCAVGRAAEALPRLAAVRMLAERLGESLDLTRCLWLQGQIDARIGRPAEALAAFGQVRRLFLEHPLPYDYALVSLDLSLVLLEQRRTTEVAKVAEEMLWIFKVQEVPPAALAALQVFCEAARQEAATVDLTRQVERFLRRAQLDPELRFEGVGGRGPE
jgi:transcriptional regulator with XRE-family HTH domain